MSRALVTGKQLWAQQDLTARRLGFRMELKAEGSQATCRLTPMTLKALTLFRQAATASGNAGMDTLEMRQYIPQPDQTAEALDQAIGAALALAKDIVG